MVAVGGIVAALQSDWGWFLGAGYVAYQIYWPLGETKFQRFQHDLTSRLDRIEVTQIAMAEEVGGMDEDSVQDLHERNGLRPSSLKDDDIR